MAGVEVNLRSLQIERRARLRSGNPVIELRVNVGGSLICSIGELTEDGEPVFRQIVDGAIERIEQLEREVERLSGERPNGGQSNSLGALVDE